MGACFSKHSQRNIEDLDTTAIATTSTTNKSLNVDIEPSNLKHSWGASNSDQKRNEAIIPSPVRAIPNSSSSSSSHSGSDTQNESSYGVIRKTSSPLRPARFNAPPSQERRKASGGIEDEEEEITGEDGAKDEYEDVDELKDCKFPSFARKQWLSQHAESLKKSSISSSSSLPAQTAMKAEVHASVRPGNGGVETLMPQQSVQTSSSLTGKKKQQYVEMDQQITDLASIVIARTPEKKKKISSLPSPAIVEASASTQRYSSPSSPLKRVQSVRDNHHQHLQGSPRISKNPSLRGSISPNRKNQEAMKARASPSQQHNNKHVNQQILPPDHQHQNSNNNSVMPSSSSSSICASSASHRRTPSTDTRDLAPLTEGYVRKPSPPKKSSPLVVIPSSSSSASASVGVVKRQIHQTKVSPCHENFTSSSASSLLPSTTTATATRKGTGNSAMAGADQKRRENSPLRRTLSVNRIVDASMEHSINSDVGHFDSIKDKEKGMNGSRKSYSRAPLREIQASERENTNGIHTKPNNFLKPQASKDKNFMPLSKASDQNMREPVVSGVRHDATLEHRAGGGNHIREDDSLELKAEKLVKGGKSVLSAFKALEEYRSNHCLVHKSETIPNGSKDEDEDEDTKYTRKQPYPTPKEPSIHLQNQPKHLSQHQNQLKNPNLQDDGMQQNPSYQHNQTQQQSPTHPLLMQDAEAEMRRLFAKKEHGIPMPSPTKKSCEPFMFPDVQSGGLTIPASISKACSILKAVADLNMGAGSLAMYTKETRDEIEKPNLSSFQFD